MFVNFFQTDQSNKRQTLNRQAMMKTVKAVTEKGTDFLKAPKTDNVPRVMS
jgi:hypothetical protein